MDRGKDDTGGKVLKQIADLHIHSRYSMATSKDGTPEMLDLWARKKGITLLGTGDMYCPVRSVPSIKKAEKPGRCTA